VKGKRGDDDDDDGYGEKKERFNLYFTARQLLKIAIIVSVSRR
jgi:hypothetical protein